jgi:hypothetical protein
MAKNKVLPAVKLQNISRDTISSASLASNKTTVFYFWSQTQMNHYQNTLKRLKKLETNNPQFRFIGICIQPFNTMVDQVQEIMKINLENQFALIDFEKASELWVLTLLNKAIIINEKGNIIEGFGNFSDTTFETLLKEL